MSALVAINELPEVIDLGAFHSWRVPFGAKRTTAKPSKQSFA
jgi:hypothetical protein